MLLWTAAGAVTSPRTVQIRAQQRYPGRVAAGAPLPSRDLTPPELADNIRYFTAGLRTPRTTPCAALVLSGARVAARPDLPDAIRLARAEGVEHVTLHADLSPGEPDVPLVPGVDRLVVPAWPGNLEQALAQLAQARAAGVAAAVNVVLRAEALPHLAGMARALAASAAARPAQVVFTYPFPLGTLEGVPLPAEAASALPEAAAALEAAGVGVAIKGLPACYLGELGDRVGRTQNRWYVDADHQKEAALLFFPGVVSFSKGEVCRFCAADHRCDGFFAAWLARPGVRPLRPLPLSAR